jgi:hypothetical protein
VLATVEAVHSGWQERHVVEEYPHFEIRDNRRRTDIMDPERHEIVLRWNPGQASVWGIDDTRLMGLWDEVTGRILALEIASYAELRDRLAVIGNQTFRDRVKALTGLPAVPSDHPVKILADGEPATDRVTCGACGRSWDDAIPTSYTPAPAGRCPFEHWHA